MDKKERTEETFKIAAKEFMAEGIRALGRASEEDFKADSVSVTVQIEGKTKKVNLIAEFRMEPEDECNP